MGLPYGEEITIVGRTVWTQSTSVTNEQTDRQKYDNYKTAQRIASRGKKSTQLTQSILTYVQLPAGKTDSLRSELATEPVKTAAYYTRYWIL